MGSTKNGPGQGMNLLVVMNWLVCFQGCQGAQEIISHVDTGSFLSPNYPNSYPRNSDIIYRNFFNSTGPQKVYVKYFHDLQRDWSSCQDYFRYMGNSIQYCGSRWGKATVDIPGNEFFIHFTSDENSSTNKGFNITFSLYRDCQPTLMSDWSNHYELMPIEDIHTRDSLVLSLRACSPVWVSFGNGSHWQLVILGRWNNTQTVSYKCKSGAGCNESKSVTHSIMDCCQFRDVWFQWENRRLRVGVGHVVGVGTFLDDSSTYDIPVKLVYMRGFQFLVKFDAIFPESYCQNPPNMTLPSSCHQNDDTTTDPSTLAASTAPLTSPDDVTSTSGDVTTTNSDVTSTAGDVATTSGDVISTADGGTTTTTADATSATTAGAIPSTTGDVTSTPEEATTTADDVTSTAGDVVSTTANDVTSTADDITTTAAADVTSTSGDITTSGSNSLSTQKDGTTAAETTETSPQTTSTTTTTATTTTTTTTTTSPSSSVTYTREQCQCNCVQQPRPAANASQEENAQREEEKKQMVQAIKKNLTMDTHTVSATVRRHVSAADGRSSSQVIGLVSGVLCAIPLCCILGFDLLAVMRRLGIQLKQRR